MLHGRSISLRQAIFVGAAIGIVLPALLLGYFLFTNRLAYEIEQRIRVPMSQYADVLTSGMAVALWNVDRQMSNELGEAVMRNPDVVSVTVIDDKNETFLRKVNTNSQRGQLLSERREIRYNGVSAGTLEVVMTAQRVSRDQLNDLLKACLAIGSQVLFSFAVIWLLFEQHMLRPLRKLQEGVLRLANGGLDQPIERSRDDEIGHLAANIESMRKDLASLIAQREHSNSEIQKLNFHLEQRVAERTVELSTALENLQAAQAELIRIEKMSALGSMVAGIAHELNTPIGNGLTVASTLQDETVRFGMDMAHGLKRSRLEEFVGAVREGSGILVRSLQHAAELVSSFKQVSVDQASANRRRFDLLDMVDELLVTLGPGLRKTPYKVDTRIPTGIGMDGYPGALGQVLTNLVNNAIQHGFDGREQGKIVLTAKLDGESHVLIRLEDDGIGIPSELLERVFDPFFTTKFGQGGSGIGLYIVYNLVTQVMGGSIRIESTSGQGTSFVLRLPHIAPEQGRTGP